MASDRMTSEADIQRAIVEALVWDGWLILRINQGGRYVPVDVLGGTGPRYVRFAYWQALGIDQQDSGISDVIAVKAIAIGDSHNWVFHGTAGSADEWIEVPMRTVLLAIEVKAPGKKANVTDKQQAFLDAIEEHGGIAVVADSLEDLEPYLDRVNVE